MSRSIDLPRGIEGHLELCGRLAQAALDRAGDQRLLESDRTTLAAYSYTEPHLAMLLYLLHCFGVRKDGLDEAAGRLRIWDALGIQPIFFCSMAVSVLGIAARQDGVSNTNLCKALAAIQARRVDYADVAWNWTCGNNMLVQQHVVDELLAPLAQGLPVHDNAADRLADLFQSCLGNDGYFFDLPRPGQAGDRQYPLTYNLKFLFLLVLCQTHLPDARFKKMLDRSMRAALSLFTADGDCSFFARTDRSTFAAGLAEFVLRAAAAMGTGGPAVADLAGRARLRFTRFAVGMDGCPQVNELGASATTEEHIWSRDDYAFRWQYAISGLAYSLLGNKMFPDIPEAPRQPQAEDGPTVYYTRDLGISRFRDSNQDVYLRSLSAPEVVDRRHAGPTILRFEHGGRKIVGTIPKTSSLDVRVLLRDGEGSKYSRHLDLLRYRWQFGYEELHADLAGFVPTLVCGRRRLVPGKLLDHRVGERSVTTQHQFVSVAAAGLAATWNHVAGLLRIRLPEALKVLLPQYSPFRGEVAVFLKRTVEVEERAITIHDLIEGRSKAARLVIGTRSFPDAKIETTNLDEQESATGWSSDGVQTLRRFSADYSGSGLDYVVRVIATD